MAKVGLKETLTLLAAGYKKKDIDALAAIDDENPQEQPDANPVSEVVKVPDSDPGQAQEKEQEPDYKSMYEELLEKNKQSEDKLKKLQQDNINKDSAPAAAEAKQKEAESLTNLVRGFM